MIPAFFGDSAEPLWGVFHSAEGTSFRNTGVVICPPIAAEHLRTYACLRRLADNLARRGFFVFRFDYCGTGDSSGYLQEASLAQWTKDTRMAVDELCDLGGIRRIALIGLRAGAIPAVLAAGSHRRVRHTLLWDPVLRGKAYVEQLRRLHRQRHRRWPGRNTRATTSETEELMGYRFSRGLLTDLQQFDVTAALKSLKATPRVICSSPQYAEQIETLNYRLVPDAGNWHQVSEIPNQLTAVQIPQAIQAMLEQETS